MKHSNHTERAWRSFLPHLPEIVAPTLTIEVAPRSGVMLSHADEAAFSAMSVHNQLHPCFG